jgi:hypothetical protein
MGGGESFGEAYYSLLKVKSMFPFDSRDGYEAMFFFWCLFTVEILISKNFVSFWSFG